MVVSHRISFSLSLSHQRQRPLKRKKITSSLKSSYSSDSLYLPDECWESIFRFIINNNDKNNNDDDDDYDYNDNNNPRNLSSLSLVSKQFMSITDRLRFSLTVLDKTVPFLDPIFKRFTNLTSLNLKLKQVQPFKADKLNEVLCKISSFPSLKLTSLDISKQYSFPANGLRAFSQNITTLTSLNCFDMNLYYDDLLLIADCFPLLKVLNLSYLKTGRTDFMYGMHVLLSKCRCIQHLDIYRTSSLNDQHVVELSLFLGNLVSINLNSCWSLTESALFSLVRKCPSLSEIKMEDTTIGKASVDNSDSLTNIDVYPQLKSLLWVAIHG